jgi:subtilase family serine protease
MSGERPNWAKRLSRVAVALALVIGSLLGLSSAMAASVTPRRVGAVPRYPRGARAVGALGSSTTIPILVALSPRDPAALASYASAVSEPGSSLYHQFLTVAQFRARFAPTNQQIAGVEASLRAHGLAPGSATANGLMIPVRASAGRLARALGTSFEQVKLASGRTAYANTRAPQFDASVAGLIQGVIGLDTLSRPHALSLELPHVSGAHSRLRVPHVSAAASTGPQPCSAASNAAPGQDAYTANEIAGAYNFNSLYSAGDEGAGITVALFELEPNSTSDISAYQSCYGTSATVSYIKEDGGSGSGSGSGEAALDIEDVIGLAPKATVDVYQAPNSNTGLIDNYTAIVDNDTAQVVSTSWGECESESGSSIISEEGTLFEQAATQGQTIYAAAGDDGSTDCETSALAVDDPASQPYVTGAGGLHMSSTSYPPTETVWNDSSQGEGAGGGGISSKHTMPTYQSGAPSSLNVINSHSSGTQCGAASGSYCREVPDVSADADPYTGYLIYYEGSWTGIGGTSAAAPLWAAFTALVDASSTCAGKSIGFANPLLYAAAASAYSSDFTDVTSGNNDYAPDGYSGGLYPAGSGYDMASGLGSPDGATLPAALCSGGSTTGNTVTVTNPGNQTSTVGTAVSLQIKASDSASGQTLTYSASGLPAGLSINSSSGLISGTPTSAGSSSMTVTAKDTTGASGSTSFSWTVNSAAGNTVTVTNPGNQTSTVGAAVSLQIKASDSASGQTLTYSVSGLPAGLSINSSSGLISGTPTTAGSSSVTVTAKDTTGASGGASFGWTVNSASTCTAKQLLGNPGFESGNTVWSATADVILNNSETRPFEVSHSGSWFAWLDGYGTPHTDTVAQTVTLPTGCTNYTVSFWKHIDTSESTSSAVDTLNVQLLNSSGTVLTTLATFSNRNAASGYQQVSYSIAAYAGQKVTLKFTGTETDKGGGTSDFCLDDTAINVS